MNKLKVTYFFLHFLASACIDVLKLQGDCWQRSWYTPCPVSVSNSVDHWPSNELYWWHRCKAVGDITLWSYL